MFSTSVFISITLLVISKEFALDPIVFTSLFISWIRKSIFFPIGELCFINSKNCDIIKQLRDEFKPVFIYHLTSILFYMSCMYKDKGHLAPKTIVFSGNGSKYIDTFISIDKTAVKRIVDLVFERVFGGEHNVNVELPQERKESTCYGGLYREPNAPHVPEFVYQGDTSMCFENVGEIVKNYDLLKRSLKTASSL